MGDYVWHRLHPIGYNQTLHLETPRGHSASVLQDRHGIYVWVDPNLCARDTALKSCGFFHHNDDGTAFTSYEEAQEFVMVKLVDGLLNQRKESTWQHK